MFLGYLSEVSSSHPYLDARGLTTGRDSVDDSLKRGFFYAHKSKGFRYYEPKIHLLVVSDNNGGFVTKFLSLPDRDRRMSVEPYSFIASQEIEFNFSNGMIGAVKADSDANGTTESVYRSNRSRWVSGGQSWPPGCSFRN